MPSMRSLLLNAVVAFASICGGVALKSPHHQQQHHTTAAKAATQVYTPAAQADQIQSLPGLATQATFNQFSGYLVVDEASQRSIHYWYVESQNAPATDPLIWWSNGGPGCSGLLGLLLEHGPFRLQEGGNTIEPYEYAWNTVANVLYVEAPAGVGFSFSNNPNDYNTNDTQTALDNYAAIEQFFIRFPHLQQNNFFLSAESYGGHYVPELAHVILEEGNVPNFKGFLLGNPLTDLVENQVYGSASTICGHSLASRPTCQAFEAHCVTNGQDDQCQALINQVQTEAGDVDVYGLDYPVCNTQQEKLRTLSHIHKDRMNEPGFPPVLKKKLEKHLLAQKKSKQGGGFDLDGRYDPCGMTEEAVYLNRADVKTALHISSSSFPWTGCSNNINYDRADDELFYMEKIYPMLLQATPPLKLVIFSGDDDSVCGTLGTQYWMYNLFGNQTTQTWNQWMYTSQEYGSQIGGSLVQFTNISLVTVHSAGHQVPLYQPERGIAVLKAYLAGEFSTTSMQPTAEASVPHPHPHAHTVPTKKAPHLRRQHRSLA